MLQGKGERRETGRNSKILIVEEESKLREIDYDAHIAHELKTPLAVIHSYAEGRKEHIAEEKRDQQMCGHQSRRGVQLLAPITEAVIRTARP